MYKRGLDPFYWQIYNKDLMGNFKLPWEWEIIVLQANILENFKSLNDMDEYLNF